MFNFKRLKERFTKPKERRVTMNEVQIIETLYEQDIMDEHTRQEAFKPYQTLDLDHIYVYTVEQDPHRLLLKPVVLQYMNTNGRQSVSLNSRTVALTSDAYAFDENHTVDIAITSALKDIKNGEMPATLERNEAIRTVNALNAESQYIQKKYNTKSMTDVVFEYKTLKEVFDIITGGNAPDSGVIKS